MIVFYPEDNGLWGDDFDFHPPITLTPKEKTDHKVFRDRNELCAYVRKCAANPVAVIELTNFQDGSGRHNVTINGMNVGVAKDDYR